MLNLTHLNYATIILDTSAVMIAFGILCETRFMRRSGNMADRLFFRMLILTMVMAVADAVAYLSAGVADTAYVKTQAISMSLFYFAFIILAVSWFNYCKFKFKDEQKEELSDMSPILFPGLFLLCLIIINLFTGIIFRVDDLGGYHRGFMFIPMYIVLIAYIAAGFVMISKYRTIEKKKLIPLWLYMMPIAFCFVITFLVGEVSMAALGTAITIAFTHLGTMNEVAEISLREMKR